MKRRDVLNFVKGGLISGCLMLIGCLTYKSCFSQSDPGRAQHIKVFYEKGKFGGWPANWGMWHWGNEILVGYTMADHKDRKGHNYDRETAVAMFSRSKDGGLTWKQENAFDHGITEPTWENHIQKGAKSAAPLKNKIDFSKKDFALTFRMRHEVKDGTSFYYTYDRGRHWVGPFDLKVNFSGPGPLAIVSRTDYIIEGKYEMTAFLTVAFEEGDKNWRQVACVRTTDGGLHWKHLSWIGPAGINSIMPSSVRLGKQKLLSVIRRTQPAEMVAFLSDDNGYTWKQLPDPVKEDSNGNPPALLQLKDGKLCLVYGLREQKTLPDGIGIYVTFSADQGTTWSRPRLLRGHDGATWDMGYARAVQLPDGKVVATYYYNNADNGDKYRYIAATIFDPARYEKGNE